MEKFERHIREKLGEREISPSPQAWEKIEKRLSSNATPIEKRNYRYVIAASFIGILIAFGFLFFPNEEDVAQKQIVEKEEIEKEVPGKNEIPKLPEEKAELVKSSKQDEIKTKIKSIEIKPSPVAIVAMEEVEKVNQEPIKDSVWELSEDIIGLKANEVLKQVVLLEKLNETEITDAEVDSLLRAAQKEILTDKLFDKRGKVDAMALLVEVEDELDESFRGQIFEALKEGYLKLRTSVADRNN